MSVELIEARGQVLHRDVDRTRDVAFCVLRLLADVDEEDPASAGLGGLRDVNLSHV